VGGYVTIDLAQDPLAAYAAILSTVTAVWKIITDVRDRAKVRVSALYGRTHPMEAKQGAPNQEYAVVEVANHGRRPLTVLAVGLTRADGTDVVIESDKLPVLLGESQTAAFKAPLKVLAGKTAIAWARDSRHKKHESRPARLEAP